MSPVASRTSVWVPFGRDSTRERLQSRSRLSAKPSDGGLLPGCQARQEAARNRAERGSGAITRDAQGPHGNEK